MATRFYFRENTAATISPNVSATWAATAAPFARIKLMTATLAGDTLTQITAASTVGAVRCYRQMISEPLSAGLVFNGETYKCYAQAFESAANDNIVSRLGVRILSRDGTTVQSTRLAVADYSTATEWNTARRNKAFANGDAGGASYTTVAGDRLVVEIGHSDAAGASITGAIFMGSQATGVTDLGENETSTSTTERPWFEVSVTVTFEIAGTIATDAPAQTTAITAGVTVSGTIATDAPAQTSAATVGVTVSATEATTAPAQTSSASVGVIVGVSIDTAAPAQTTEADGTVEDAANNATIATDAPPQTSSATIGVVVGVAADTSAAAQTSSATGAVTVSGTIGTSAPAQTSTAAIGVEISGTAATEAPAQTSAVTIGAVVGVSAATEAPAQTSNTEISAIAGVSSATVAPAQTSAVTIGAVVGASIATSAPAQTTEAVGEVTEYVNTTEIATVAPAQETAAAVGVEVGVVCATEAPAQNSSGELSGAYSGEMLYARVRPLTEFATVAVIPRSGGQRVLVRPLTAYAVAIVADLD